MFIISLINVTLLILIAVCLKLHRTGIFTFGFFNVIGALFPVFVLYPLCALLFEDSVIYRHNFIWVLLMVTCMLTGLLVGVMSDKRKVIPIYNRVREMPVPSVFLLGLLVLSLGALLLLLSSFRGTLNPIELLQSARSDDQRILYGQYELGYPLLFLQSTILTLLMLLVFGFYRRSSSFLSFLKGLIVTLVTGFVMISFGSRNSFFMPIVLFIMATHHLYRRVPTSLVAGLLVLAIPVFVFLRIMSAGHSLEDLASQGALTDLSIIAQEFIDRFAGFVNFVDFLDWFEEKQCVFGLTMLQFIVRPIPRSIMPDKPASLDVFLSYDIYGTPVYGGNVAIFGGLGEMHYNFWFVGIFIWFILVGVLLSRVHFGTLKLLSAHRFTAVAFIFGNYSLLRGIANLGVNTSGTQQLVINLATQVLIYLLLMILLLMMGRNDNPRPGIWPRSFNVSVSHGYK